MVSTRVRGMGVAVMTRSSAARPFSASVRRCATPNRCCSSTITRPRSRKRDAVAEEGMRPDHEVDRAVCEAGQGDGPFAGTVAPGQHGEAQAGRFGERRDAGVVLASQDLGRGHQGGLAPGFDHAGGREQRHDRLAGTDVALEQPQHAARRRHIGPDLVERPLLASGQRRTGAPLRSGRRCGRRRGGAVRCRPWRGCAAAPRPVGLPAARHRRAAAGPARSHRRLRRSRAGAGRGSRRRTQAIPAGPRCSGRATPASRGRRSSAASIARPRTRGNSPSVKG